MREQVFVRPLALMLSGLLVWGGHFTLIYAFNAYICARGLAGERVLNMGMVPLGIGVITLVALLVLAVLMLVVVIGHRPRLQQVEGEAIHGFSRALALSVMAFSALAVLTQAVPAYIVPACA